MKNTISVCQFHSYRLHLLYSIYQLPQIRENTLYVLSGLAYLAKHNGFQFHSRCCKRISFYIMAEQYSTVSISFFSVFSHVLMDICIAQHIILVHFRWFTHVLAQMLYFYLALHQNIQAVFKKFMKHNYHKKLQRIQSSLQQNILFRNICLYWRHTVSNNSQSGFKTLQMFPVN